MYIHIREIIMNLKLTTVKLLEDLYKDFKTLSFEKEFTLQKLVNRSMELYVSDNNFKKRIEQHKALKPSGSNL